MSLHLSPAQARVIASLVEKSITTPRYYPMTVNAIRLACNQKSSRDPVMALTDGEVGAALLALEDQGCCSRDGSGARAERWRHALQHALTLQPGPMAVLVVLMLRGPQTVAELRTRAAVLGGSPDASGVEAALADLGDRAQPLAARQPRGHGQKEDRWMHRLCEEPGAGVSETEDVVPYAAGPAQPQDRVSQLERRVEDLEARVAALESARAPD